MGNGAAAPSDVPGGGAPLAVWRSRASRARDRRRARTFFMGVSAGRGPPGLVAAGGGAGPIRGVCSDGAVAALARRVTADGAAASAGNGLLGPADGEKILDKVVNLPSACERILGDTVNLPSACEKIRGGVVNLTSACETTLGEVANLPSGCEKNLGDVVNLPSACETNRSDVVNLPSVCEKTLGEVVNRSCTCEKTISDYESQPSACEKILGDDWKLPSACETSIGGAVDCSGACEELHGNAGNLTGACQKIPDDGAAGGARLSMSIQTFLEICESVKLRLPARRPPALPPRLCICDSADPADAGARRASASLSAAGAAVLVPDPWDEIKWAGAVDRMIERQKLRQHLARTCATTSHGGHLFTVSLHLREGDTWGVIASPCHDGCLEVNRIREGGAVSAWNRTADAGSQIVRGDRIVKINAVSWSVDAMAREMRACRGVVLHVVRPRFGDGNAAEPG